MIEEHDRSPSAQSYVEPGRPGVPWADVLEEVQRSFTFWIATVRPRGRPHVVPVLAVLNAGALHFAAGPTTQKARNLANDPAATVTTQSRRFDLVLEGLAHRVSTAEALTTVADAYASKYGWEVQADDGALHGDGAPTAGPPPYHVFRLTLHQAFGFPTSDDATPTRWTFQR